jgi:membrane protein DedA with SNARE-associated domain
VAATVLHVLPGLASPWAYVPVAALACAESAALAGLVIPGEAALMLGGFLASAGRVSLPAVTVAAAAGAIAGDSAGYEMGRRFGPALRRSRAGRRVGQARWARVEAYLAGRAGRAVFFGRWIGPARALVPALAGMTGLPYRTFLPWNVAGGLTWAPAVVLAGYAAGDSYQQLHRLIGQGSLALAAVAAVLIAAAWAVRRRRRPAPRDPGGRPPAPPRETLAADAGARSGADHRAPEMPRPGRQHAGAQAEG